MLILLSFTKFTHEMFKQFPRNIICFSHFESNSSAVEHSADQVQTGCEM